MSRYIDLNTALSFPYANGEYDKKNANPDFIKGCESYKEWLESLPAVDIVRCFECRWFVCNMRPDGYVPYGLNEYWCRKLDMSPDPTDGCSMGERMEGAEE